MYESTLLRFGVEAGIPFWADVVRRVAILSRESKEVPIITYLTAIAMDEICAAVKNTDMDHNLSDLGPGNLRDKYELSKDYLNFVSGVL